jgi:molybdopterin converting factor small subunit
MAKIIIPTPLRKFTNNEPNFQTTKGNVKEAVAELTDKFPDLKYHLYDNDGKIRSFIKVFVGEDDIRGLEDEATAVGADTVISIVPAIAGGNY